MSRESAVWGKVYYPSGTLYFEGLYDKGGYTEPEKYDKISIYEGTVYYENGHPKCEGIFQLAGLLKGKKYYPSGALWFEGECNDKSGSRGNYYGPSYPISGKFYDESGVLIFEGRPKVISQGGVGYPKVVEPEGFKLSWK